MSWAWLYWSINESGKSSSSCTGYRGLTGGEVSIRKSYSSCLPCRGDPCGRPEEAEDGRPEAEDDRPEEAEDDRPEEAEDGRPDPRDCPL